jgi:guanine nucleotide-binding protein alpha-1 subunit
MRLSPLLAVETALNRKLSPENYNPESTREVFVRAGSNWKITLSSMTSPKASEASEQKKTVGKHSERSADDPTNILAACREDIVALWADPIIRGVLQKQNIRLEDSAGLYVEFPSILGVRPSLGISFLDDTDRVTQADYEPTDGSFSYF